MLHTKFPASKPSNSEEEDFLIFSMYFYGLNLGPPAAGPSSNLGPSFEQTWLRTTRQCCIPNFKHLSQVVLKKKIYKNFYMYFYGSNLGPPARGHLGP